MKTTEFRILQGELMGEFDAVPTKDGWMADGYTVKDFTDIGFVEGNVTVMALTPGLVALPGPSKLVFKSNRVYLERV